MVYMYGCHSVPPVCPIQEAQKVEQCLVLTRSLDGLYKTISEDIHKFHKFYDILTPQSTCNTHIYEIPPS